MRQGRWYRQQAVQQFTQVRSQVRSHVIKIRNIIQLKPKWFFHMLDDRQFPIDLGPFLSGSTELTQSPNCELFEIVHSFLKLRQNQLVYIKFILTPRNQQECEKEVYS